MSSINLSTSSPYALSYIKAKEGKRITAETLKLLPPHEIATLKRLASDIFSRPKLPIHDFTPESLTLLSPLAKEYFEEIGPYTTGFGEHPPFSKTGTFLKHFGQTLLWTALAVACVFYSIFWPLSVGLTLLAIKEGFKAAGSLYTAPSTASLFANLDLPALGEFSSGNYSGIPIQDSVEAHKWKMELIRHAQKSIVMSGNFCGGKSFDEMLDLMKERLQKNGQLCISIISSSIFLTNENKARLEALKKKYPDRFECVVTPEGFPYISPTTNEFRITANHTKLLVIDYGHYFQIGGSGIEPSWTDHAGDKAPKDVGNTLLPGAYRDMDFVFHCPEQKSIGARFHVEILKLFARFKHWEDPKKAMLPRSLEQVQGLKKLEKFHQNFSKKEGLKIACYATGPEQEQNNYYQEILKQIRSAKERIVIQNMYFHPSKEMAEALKDALKRGVKVQIVTNDNAYHSPYLHMTYAELSKYEMQALTEGQIIPHLELYEYSLPNVSFHKKVLVFDNSTVLTGTANVGYKSLEGRGDYEVNVAVESDEFARATLKVLDGNLKIAKRIDPKEASSISLKTRALSTAQSLLKDFF
jgi:phosphatidylserine/phosphatidylglycerophosphate/cardiolipin synthase-like enzyme